ncbi:antibiotic biosynthesis monooxygenase family protein [uncultured Nitratireductor sp.]|uniref:antibiotic biosynthesis monooxygenase family protein n=1 Tax=uncultured Nitratireductor sp. TaxID=520953 RepID=UPI0025EF1C0B|nr:antibiotic biosynthesis monooxygenase family protein [uncultured Nitratireductor sp.]
MTRSSTIDPENGGVTLINVYEVEPEKQAELVALLSDATDTQMRHCKGFVSVNIHSSLDGSKVINYAQWATQEDFEAMLKNNDAQAQMKRFAAVAKSVSPALYKVNAVHRG